MAEYTENYNLKKPAQEDFYNVDDFNNNADIIDSQLKTLSDGLGSAAQESTVSEIDTKIGETGNTGGSTTAGSVFAKLNKIISDLTTHMGRWTAARAGYIDTINTNASSAKTAAVNAQNYTVTNNTASKTGILSQKESYTHSLLENTNYGLNAIRNVAGGNSPSLTGLGTTIYSYSEKLQVGISVVGKTSKVIPIAKFIAPVNGMYCITADISSGSCDLYKYGNTNFGFSNGHYISRFDPFYIYAQATIGTQYDAFVSSYTEGPYWLSASFSQTSLFSGSKFIGSNNTSSKTFSFYCLAGEPVIILATNIPSTVIYNSIVITYQKR